jgi:hypothetical protein
MSSLRDLEAATKAQWTITTDAALVMFRMMAEKAASVVEGMTKGRQRWLHSVEMQEVEAAEEGDEAPAKATMTAPPALLPAPTEALPPTELARPAAAA